MTRLTSVYGLFRARVMEAKLASEGYDVELRGAVHSPYALTVGEMARVDIYVPVDQAEAASLVLLVDEVDEADVVLDDDLPPRTVVPAMRRTLVTTAAAGLGIASVVLAVRCY